jgi:hypothetical protein
MAATLRRMRPPVKRQNLRAEALAPRKKLARGASLQLDAEGCANAVGTVTQPPAPTKETMTPLDRMDLFFAITSFAVVAVAAVLCFVGWRLARLIGSIHRLADEAVDEAKALRADVGEAREAVRREGFKLRHVLGLVGKVGSRLAGRSTRKR